MMTNMIRIISRLDIKGPNVVKGVHFEGLRVIGRPELLAPLYYQDGADEIIYIDCVASLYDRNSLGDIVRRAAENIFIPLTVGGGVRTVDDIQMLLRAGADKVAVNTWAIKNPKLITDGAKAFGSQCIVVFIQAKNRAPGKYECLTDNARETTGVDVFDWARRVTDLGAGEILLASVDKDGTGSGYDVELVERVAKSVSIPVIASGGAGNAAHVKDVILQGSADAVACASIFHYGMLDHMAQKSEYNEEGNTEFLKKRLPMLNQGRKGIESVSISSLKAYLIGSGINCRAKRTSVTALL